MFFEKYAGSFMLLSSSELIHEKNQIIPLNLQKEMKKQKNAWNSPFWVVNFFEISRALKNVAILNLVSV